MFSYNNSQPTPRRWFMLFCLGLILVTSLPYLYAQLITPEDKIFTGAHTLAPADLPVYFSYIEQAKAGQTVFKDLFTSEAHSSFIFSPPWLIIGWLARWLGLSSLVAFHIARVLLIPIFLITVNLWLKLFFPKIIERRFGLWLIALGGGLGWLVEPLLVYIYNKDFIINIWPMDLWVSEAYGYLTMYQTPHFLASTSLILLCLYWFLSGFIKNSYKLFILSGVSLLALMSFHPFHLPTIGIVIGLFIIYQWIANKKFPKLAVKGALIVIGIGSPMILYQGLLLWLNPIAAGRAGQNINAIPAWWSMLLSYGALIPLALLALARKIKQLDAKWSFLVIWFASQYIIFTMPSLFNRRLTQFWLLPLVILAVFGWKVISQKLAKKGWSPSKTSLVFLFVLFFALSPIVVVSKDIVYWNKVGFRDHPYHFYLPSSYLEAGRWLRQNSDEQSVIIANAIGGLYLPSLALRQVVIGHKVETLEYASKWESLKQAVLQGDTEAFVQLAKSWKADYLLIDERDSAWKNIDCKHPSLERKWQSAPLTLYKIN